MKAVAFDYERPGRIEEACALLAREDVLARPLAGGQSLGPMLNLRLAQPELLVDVTRLAELGGVERDGGVLRIGACVTHAALEDGCVPDRLGRFLAQVARWIAYRAVRNRGTIGGSVAHADPAADWLSCLAALGASVTVHGPDGRRSLTLGEFVTGAFEVALAPGEMLESIRVPEVGEEARFGFYKFCRKTGEFAQAIGAVLDDPAAGVLRVVIGGTSSAPHTVEDPAALFGGGEAGAARLDREAAARAVAQADPGGDAYSHQIHLVALQRAVAQL